MHSNSEIELCNEIKTRQAKNFELLLEFDQICKANNLFYTLAYGTALGAIRDQNLIPWDCDIDVIIDLKTYEFLKKHYANRILDNQYSHHCYQFPRFIFPNDVDEKNEKPIFIDMFILIPTTIKKVKKYINSFKNKADATKGYFNRNIFFIQPKLMKFVQKLLNFFLFKNKTLTIDSSINQLLESNWNKDDPDSLYVLTIWPSNFKKIKNQHLLKNQYVLNGLTTVYINNHQFSFFKDKEAIMEQWYGPNWKIPIQEKNWYFYGYYEKGKKKAD
ncbi:diacylglycerol cholinephosphotransferase Mf1 [Mycoplasmopsis gallinarum]